MKLYNDLTNQSVLKMRGEAIRYYEHCFERFSKGEFFVPEGIVKTSFERIVQQLTSQLIDVKHQFEWGCPLSSATTKQLQFGMHHREVHVAKIDWSVPHYVTDDGSVGVEPFVFRVVSIETTFRFKRKFWVAVLVDGTRFDLCGASTVFRAINTYPKNQQTEMRFPEEHVPAHWQLLVKRGRVNVDTPSSWQPNFELDEHSFAQIMHIINSIEPTPKD
ncbi:MAG: hypothetical protein Alis3KO_05670 [Aliiglaciecola sp.]